MDEIIIKIQCAFIIMGMNKSCLLHRRGIALPVKQKKKVQQFTRLNSNLALEIYKMNISVYKYLNKNGLLVHAQACLEGPGKSCCHIA